MGPGPGVLGRAVTFQTFVQFVDGIGIGGHCIYRERRKEGVYVRAGILICMLISVVPIRRRSIISWTFVWEMCLQFVLFSSYFTTAPISLLLLTGLIPVNSA